MDAPLCKFCHHRHWPAFSCVPDADESPIQAPVFTPIPTPVGPPPVRRRPAQQAPIRPQHGALAARLRAMDGLDMALIHEAADLIEQLSLSPGTTPESRARKRDYMRDYMRQYRATKAQRSGEHDAMGED